MYQINRRRLLGSSAIALLLNSGTTRAAMVKGGLPWKPGSADPPAAVTPDGWRCFTPQEGRTVEAFVDRLIPPDPETPGGKEAGCAIYIDRQLAGPHGRFEGHYMSGPFQKGTKEQGPQSPVTPAEHYRTALTALDKVCRGKFGKAFAELSDEQKDETIKGLEDGSLKLEGTDGKEFFELIVKDTQKGFGRPCLRRQQGHGGMEDDRLPRHALRLSRLDRSSQPARHIANCQHRHAPELVAVTVKT